MTLLDKFSGPDSWRLGAWVVCVAYVALYSWGLIHAGGLPYVMDNNESFSAYVHGYNMFHFDWGKSFGLTDEAASPFASGHPVAHTHQGNWPRFFTFVLYAAGIDSIEGQIAAATFTVGLGGIFLAYLFVSRLVSPVFAVLFVLLLMTDYILFAQWQVNSYRVWQAFLVFSALCLVQGLEGRRWPWCAALLFVHHFVLFYNELVFGAFLALVTGLYSAWRCRTMLRRLFLAGIAQTAGCLSALAVLVLQLDAFMGWENVVRDFTLTLGARNAAADPATVIRGLREFYEQFNIATFYNLVDGATLRNAATFLRGFFATGFQVYTPQLALIFIALSLGWIFALPGGSGNARKKAKSPNGGWWCAGVVLLPSLAGGALWASRLYPPATLWVIVAIILVMPVLFFLLSRRQATVGWDAAVAILMPPVLVLSLCVVASQGRAGQFPPSGPGLLSGMGLQSLVALSIAAFLSVGVARFGRWQWCGPIPLERVTAVAGMVLLSAGIVILSPRYYDQNLVPLWGDAALLPLGNAFWGTATLIALGVGMSIAMGGRHAFGGAAERLRPLVPFLLLAFLCYVAIYRLATGYVHSGYLWRFAPLMVFIVGVFPAVALYLAGIVAGRAWKEARVARRPGAGGGLMAGAAVVSLLPVLMVVQWGVAQAAWFRLLPPDSFAFTKVLASAGIKPGDGIVSNNYALPFFTGTGTWAYPDPVIGTGSLVKGSKGYDYMRDRRYLWLADRRRNRDYLRPAYFVCFFGNTFNSALDALHPEPLRSRPCSSLGLVRNAMAPELGPMRPEIIARDKKWDRWAIVKMDWDFPPFLALFPGQGDNLVLAEKGGAGKSGRLTVRYRFVQQDGRPEKATRLDVFMVYRQGQNCAPRGKPVASVIANGGRGIAVIPEGLRGLIAVRLTPTTATKAGLPGWSRVFTVGDQGMELVKAPCRVATEEMIGNPSRRN
jgi:hypothetical protein